MSELTEKIHNLKNEMEEKHQKIEEFQKYMEEKGCCGSGPHFGRGKGPHMQKHMEFIEILEELSKKVDALEK